MYLHTVRGETRILNLSSSSLAMRSSPQEGFSCAIRRISAWSSLGIAGRPGWDFRRQSNRQPARCQRSSVASFTTTNELRQSSCQQRKADAGCGVDASGTRAALDVQRQLAAQEKILGADCIGGTEQQPHPPNGVFYETTRDQREEEHVGIVPQPYFWRFDMRRTEYLRTTGKHSSGLADGPVQRRVRLGGMLSFYQRTAA